MLTVDFETIQKEVKAFKKRNKSDQHKRFSKNKLKPIFFTFDTIDGGKVDKHSTRHFRRTFI